MIENLYKSTESTKSSDVQELFIDIKKILLATDGSKSALSATKQAIGWARFFKAHVRAVFVDLGNNVTALHRKTLAEYVESEDSGVDGYDGLIFAKEYAAQHEVECEQVVLMGNVARRIVDYAEVYSPDLIVIGNSEKSGLRRSLGSIVDAVMKGTDIPVLVATSDS